MGTIGAPIVGGHGAPHGDYPWMASLWANNGIWADSSVCGATLVGPRWVLTAAHCVGAFDYARIGPTEQFQRDIVQIVQHSTLDVAMVEITSTTYQETLTLNIDPGFPASLDLANAQPDDANVTCGRTRADAQCWSGARPGASAARSPGTLACTSAARPSRRGLRASRPTRSSRAPLINAARQI